MYVYTYLLLSLLLQDQEFNIPHVGVLLVWYEQFVLFHNIDYPYVEFRVSTYYLFTSKYYISAHIGTNLHALLLTSNTPSGTLEEICANALW